jgi:hypothetical protein
MVMSNGFRVCNVCGSDSFAVSRDGFLTCENCGFVIESTPELQPRTHVDVPSVAGGFIEPGVPHPAGGRQYSCSIIHDEIVKLGFRDPAYCAVALVTGLGVTVSEAASLLGMPVELALFALHSIADGIPLDMRFGPKAFMPLRKLDIHSPSGVLKVRLYQEGSFYVRLDRVVPLRPLYAAKVALASSVLRKTIAEPIAVRSRSGVSLCANVGCIPKQLPILKRFREIASRERL